MIIVWKSYGILYGHVYLASPTQAAKHLLFARFRTQAVVNGLAVAPSELTLGQTGRTGFTDLLEITLVQYRHVFD